MTDLSILIQDVFSKNRAEEIGYDVWKHFVIPPFFDLLDIYSARKPRAIIGGRGCGKTMLLRYFSHQSMFSPSRENIPDKDLTHIGLYWRPDTQFCNAMMKRGISDDTWAGSFNHYVAIIIGLEVLRSLKSIAKSVFPKINEIDINNLNFDRLRYFNPNLPNTHNVLYEHLEGSLWEFESWVNDVRKKKEPGFLPGKEFVSALISLIKDQISVLNDAIFFVYIDEFENLSKYQQQIINTWLKHSEVPLIFNLAMKRSSFENTKTLGQESLADIHDLRKHDIEEYALDNNFPVFAAEILFLTLSLANIRTQLPIDINELRDPNKIKNRTTQNYSKKVLNLAKELFPQKSNKELAYQVFIDVTLMNKLKERIQKALDYRRSDIPVESFLHKNNPEASIIAPALLYRRKLDPKDIINELNLLEKGEDNRFTNSTSWIHNNFIACILQLYAPYSRSCPFYSGFQTFCSLSKGNLRHFLELCHKSLSKISISNQTEYPIVDTSKQAEAARQASAAFLGEVRSFGKYGNQLHAFVLRLGSLFALSHQRLTQSENEQSHFTITKGMKQLSEPDYEFINEAIKWSVLSMHTGTKKKDLSQPETIEYILNPIYAPYFYITYRKKRRLELSSDDFITLIRGSIDQFSELMKQYKKKWFVEYESLTLPIFSLFDEDQNDN